MDKHTINEFPDNLKNKLILKSNFEECIDLCDFCFIIKDITDSSLKIDYLISLIKTHGLPYYCIELSNNTETDLSKLMYLKTVPNILILNYGEYTQQYCTEIALFNAFKNREIDIFQKFSPFTDYFLKKTQEIIPIYTNGSYGKKKRARVIIGEEIYLSKLYNNNLSKKENVENLTEYVRNTIISLGDKLYAIEQKKENSTNM